MQVVFRTGHVANLIPVGLYYGIGENVDLPASVDGISTPATSRSVGIKSSVETSSERTFHSVWFGQSMINGFEHHPHRRSVSRSRSAP